MKKIVIFVFVLVMTTGLVIAQNSGFSVGGEVGVINFKDPDKEDIIDNLYLMPTLSYEGFLMGEALEFNADLGVPFWINPALWLGIDLDLKLTYNMGNLSIIAENYLTIPVLKDEDTYVYPSSYRYPYSPLFSKGNHFGLGFFNPRNTYSKAYDFLSPGVKYDLFFNTGTLYLQADLPLRFMPEAFDYVYLNLSAGWKGENGFGINIKEYNLLRRPGDEIKFFQRLDLTASYETDTFSGELDIGVPLWEDAMRYEAVTIIPKVEFRFENGLKVYGNIPIYHIGAEYRDMMFGLAVGVKKSF